MKVNWILIINQNGTFPQRAFSNIKPSLLYVKLAITYFSCYGETPLIKIPIEVGYEFSKPTISSGVSWPFHLSIYLSIYLSVYISIVLSIYLSYYVSIYLSFHRSCTMNLANLQFLPGLVDHLIYLSFY